MARRRVAGYSDLVLKGVESLGYSRAAIARAARVSEGVLDRIADGEREFTDAQIFRIEDLADKTGGQLAALVVEPNGGPLTSLSNQFGVFRKTFERTSKPGRVRRARARRVPAHKA